MTGSLCGDVNDLEEYNNYNITSVVLINCAGTGPSSPSVQIQTLQAGKFQQNSDIFNYHLNNQSFITIVSAEPLNLNATDITATSFCVTFSPPTGIDQNGQVTSYSVTHQGELFGTTEVNTTVSVSPAVYPLIESSSVCISNLEEYNNYTVSLRAVNGAGEGTAALIIVHTLEAGSLAHIVRLLIH